jgi:SAM-dependent methyltransferase
MAGFYDQLAPYYHLIFADWEQGIARQGQAFAAILREQWPGHRSVLDVSCGIGTQAIALAENGFWVKASDISAGAIERARSEAASRGLVIEFSLCDMRQAFACHGGGFDIVFSGDNSVAHLLSDAEITRAFESMYACLKPGGGCLITVRDYEHEPRGTGLVKPYGVRIENGRRWIGLQVWDFDGDQYDMTLYLIEEDLATGEVQTHAMRTRCYAAGTKRLLTLLKQAGFVQTRRLDDVYYQPVLIGTRPLESNSRE